jgi:membrane-bound lytic murein transglycosylase B
MTENDAWGLDASTTRTGGVWWRVLLVVSLVLVAAVVWGLVQLSQVRVLPPESFAPAPLATVAPPVEQPVVAPEEGATQPAPLGISADPAWTSRTAGATGIPARALHAYATAALVVGVEQPSCGIGWNTLAGIGAIESGHGSHGGAVLRADGYPDPPIRGIALDGTQSAEIRDTDGGRWDGDTVWDRAVGPMQFIPDTWERWGADANGDGAADPNQIDDAALAAARYLCHGGEMTSVEGWRAAIFSYNNLESYVNDVATTANVYASRAQG